MVNCSLYLITKDTNKNNKAIFTNCKFVTQIA